MQRVFLSFCEADRSFAEAVAQSLEMLGRAVAISWEGGAGAEDIEAARQYAAMVVVWSTNCVENLEVRQAVEAGAAAGNLLVVRLDHAPLPRADAPAIEWSFPGEILTSQARAALADALAEVELRDGKQGAGRLRFSKPLVGRRSAMILGLLAMGLALGAGAAWTLRERWRTEPSLGVIAAPSLEDGAPAGAQTATSVKPGEIGEALQRWAETGRNDPEALRSFAARFPGTSLAAEAEALIQNLDLEQWSRIKASQQVLERLALLAAYRAAFPAGAQIAAVRDLEREALQEVAAAEAELERAGHPVAQGGASREDREGALRRALRAFQIDAGLGVTGDLDAATRERLLGPVALPGPSPASGENVEPASGKVAGADVAPSSERANLEPAARPAEGAPSIDRPISFRDCYVCPQMVLVPAGAFEMGDLAGEGDLDERPVRRVTILAPFAVSKFEVTFEEWDACHADGGCKMRPDDNGWGRGRQPAINISWSDARQYAAWLARKTGKPYRLLSEAEWEYAARAGAQTRYAFGEDPAEICAHGNIADEASSYGWRNERCEDEFADRPAPAGSFGANAFGLHDMLGNVWEWTADCWHPNYVGAPNNGLPWVTACAEAKRVLRGGAFSVDPAKARAAYRYAFEDKPMPFFGFRVATSTP